MTLEILLPYLAGLLGVPVVNFIKVRFGLAGSASVYLSLGVSVALALGALALTGGFTGADLPANIAIAFAVAQAAYKLLPSGFSQLGA
jgi:hypothetical protein